MKVKDETCRKEKVARNYIQKSVILGDPGAACRDEGIFVGESLLQE